MKIFYAALFLIFISFNSCNNLEDVKPETRQSFTHFFGGSSNYYGKVVEVDTDGYIFGIDSIGASSSSAVIVKTDAFGAPVWRKVILNASVNSIKIESDGYLIFGASIQYIDTVQQIDKVKSNARLVKMNSNGTVMIDKVFSDAKLDPSNINTRIDYIGNAIMDRAGTLISVINFKRPGANQMAIVAAHNPTTLDTLWTERYYLLDRDFLNGKAVTLTSSNDIIWASSAVTENQVSKGSYLNIPVVAPQSKFINSGRFGANEDSFYSGNDIKKSAVGFGVVGTYSTKTGTNANMYYVKVDPSGNIVSGTELFFDASLSKSNKALAPADKAMSETQDTGDAIAVASDGGFLLAGTTTTTATASGNIGNGGTDIFLVRIDAFGKVLWNKIIGGSGNESVASVRQSPDGGFILGGSNNLNGLSSAVLIKIDNNGELKK